MKLLLYTFSLLLSTTAVLKGQGFTEYVDKADSLYKAKAYTASGEYYDLAFALEQPKSVGYYNAACSWALAGDKSKALSYLKKAAETGYINKNWMELDSDLLTLHEEDPWGEVLSIVQANIDEAEKDFNKPLKAQLEHIYVRDQTLRQLYLEAESKFGQNSEEMTYFWSVVGEEDKKNEEEIVSILEEEGWPGRSIVGGKANAAVWMVIQHAPLALQEQYLPLLKESVAIGESQGSHLAMMEDRILVRNDRPQTYGSQYHFNEEENRNEFYPIEDREQVDQRRASVGLGTLKEYMDRFKVFFPSGQE